MATVARPVTFSDVLPIPQVKARSAILVVGFALLTALLAQIQIHLGWTPVPLTLQTFGVLLAGAVLGSRLGVLSQALYVVLGLFLPFYAGGTSGWSVFSGANGGYLVGMIFAAFIVGYLAERSEDRRFTTSISAMVLGSVVIYAFGAIWLAHSQKYGIQTAVMNGVAPFLIGDAIKSVVAGGLLPTAWKLTKAETNK